MKPFSIAAVSIFLSLPAVSHANPACSASSGRDRVPLVELYTSEGCSSCPPADRWLSSLVERSDINLLAFHVDYWDYIGWPDQFALRGNSERQRKRVNSAGGDTVYTPQVMVGEQVRVPWNSADKFKAALLNGGGAAGLDLELEVLENDGKREVIVRSGESNPSAGTAQVWLARTLDGQSSRVRSGENRGATLKHDAIVRQLWGPWAPPVRQSVLVDDLGGAEASWNFVVFAQDIEGRALQSLALHASSCAGARP